MYPTQIEFQNVGPYRGSHKVSLGEGTWAVVAQYADNPNRSNWAGKSTFLWLVPYGLYGQHPAKTDDAWITDGEDRAEVRIVLSDGSKIRRTKSRGKPTQIRATLASGEKLTQKAAQREIDRLLGMTRDDFLATCFYEQKQLARMVSARSAERIAIVEAWLAEDLEPIQNMHAVALLDLADLNRKISDLDRQISVAQPDDEHEAALLAQIERLRADGDNARAREAEATQARLQAESWAPRLKAAQRFEVISARGRQLRDELDALDASRPRVSEAMISELDSEVEGVAARLETAKAARRALLVVGADFDGRCPVVGRECPSRKWIASSTASPDAVEDADQEVASAQARLAGVKVRQSGARSHRSKISQLEAQLATLRQQAAEVIDEANAVAEGDPPDVASLDLALADARRATTEAAAEFAAAASALDAYRARVGDRLPALQTRRGELVDQRQIVAQAVDFLGKSGAQQKIGEIALSAVEAGANAILTSAGIDLSVSVQWVSHLQGLAKHCDQCGTAYPPSQRIKTCPQCGRSAGQMSPRSW